MNKIRDIFAASVLMLSAGTVMAQVDLNATDANGSPGGDVDVFIELTGDGSTSTPSWRLIYPTSEVSAVDASQCDASTPDISTDTSVNCSAGCGLFDPGVGFDCVSYILLPTNVVANTPVASTTFGPITFTIDPGAAAGSSFDVFFDDTDLVGTTDPGTISVALSPGVTLYSSNPAIGENVDFGSAVVNSTTAGQTIVVSNEQTDGTSFNIQGTTGGASAGATIDVTAPAMFPTAVPGDGGTTTVDVTFTCTPTSRGPQTGTLTVDNNADLPLGDETYPFDCRGLSPNVAVSPITVNISGSTADATAPTGSFDVTNIQDGSASDALNAAIADLGNSAEISILTGLADNTITVGETDTVTLECDNSVATGGVVSETIRLTYDDPVAAGQIDVTVNCDISDVAPGYTSNPAVPGPLAFGQIANGDTSAPQTIDIGNEGSVGTGAGAELEITGAVLSDTTNYSFAPDPFTATLAADAPNGTASVDVTCGPQSIGNFPATLTVNTNDGDQVYNLTCEGTSNAGFAVSPAGALDGTLNIGSVPPNTLTSGSMTISNTGTDPLEVDCTLTDNNMGVIAFNPVPAFPVTIPPDLTLTFQGTPPGIGTFSETLDCTVTDPSVTAAPDPDTFSTTIAVTGRPLVIPTMSRWGLVVMSLMLLLVAGFAGRRMMA